MIGKVQNIATLLNLVLKLPKNSLNFRRYLEKKAHFVLARNREVKKMRVVNRWLPIFGLILASNEVDSAELATADPTLIAEGTALYQENCAICHGAEGDGNGPLATGFTPRPRNFLSGSFKFRSTGVGEAPAREDLLKTIKFGIHGSYGQSMPAFDYLTERELSALSEVIRMVAGIQEFGVAITPPARPARADIEKGKVLFQELQCAGCHGETGNGQGDQAATLTDENGHSIKPADFRTGQFKGGNEPEDIWMRIYAGVNGTPMPAFGRNSSAADIWAVTEYVIQFGDKE